MRNSIALYACVVQDLRGSSSQRVLTFLWATDLACGGGRVIVYKGRPGVECTACTPTGMVAVGRPSPRLRRVTSMHGSNTVKAHDLYLTHLWSQGMNAFLKQLDVTFRRDPSNDRPRINKHMSLKDREQRAAGAYYLDDESSIKKATKQKKKGNATAPEEEESSEEEPEAEWTPADFCSKADNDDY